VIRGAVAAPATGAIVEPLPFATVTAKFLGQLLSPLQVKTGALVQVDQQNYRGYPSASVAIPRHNGSYSLSSLAACLNNATESRSASIITKRKTFALAQKILKSTSNKILQHWKTYAGRFFNVMEAYLGVAMHWSDACFGENLSSQLLVAVKSSTNVEIKPLSLTICEQVTFISCAQKEKWSISV